jgi:hypothetical protein
MAEQLSAWKAYCQLLTTLHASPQQMLREEKLIEDDHAAATAAVDRESQQIQIDLLSKRSALQAVLDQARASLATLNDNRFQLQQKLAPGRDVHPRESVAPRIPVAHLKSQLESAIQHLVRERRSQIAARRKADEDEVRLRLAEEDRLARERVALQQQQAARQRQLKMFALIVVVVIMVGIAALRAIFPG